MRVTQSWGHYRLYLDGNDASENRFTDLNGYVQFPERTTRVNFTQENYHAGSYAHGNYHARRMGRFRSHLGHGY